MTDLRPIALKTFLAVRRIPQPRNSYLMDALSQPFEDPISSLVNAAKALKKKLNKPPKKRLPEHPGVTQLMIKIRNGDNPACDSKDHQLLQLVQQEVRDIANQAWLRRMGGGLQGSDLVSEVWLKILKGGESKTPWESREHFFNTVAITMQRAILDELEKLDSLKRGRGFERVYIDIQSIPCNCCPSDIAEISEAIEKLEAHDPQAAMIVRMKFFLGYDFSKIATISDCSLAEIRKKWIYGKTWIKSVLAEPSQGH